MSRCLNRSVTTDRMRRYNVTTLTPLLQNTLAEWLSIQELPSDRVICNACFVLLNQRLEEGIPGRVMGYPMVCIGCGCSVMGRRYSVRHHTLGENSPLIDIFISWNTDNPDLRTNLQACHSCWVRANRHLLVNIHRQNDVLQENEPGVPEPPPILLANPPPPPPANNPAVARIVDHNLNYLPSYKCAPNTSSHCIFRECNNQSGHLIPTFVKILLLKDHNYYIPMSCRICEMHLFANEWHLLPENSNTTSYFTIQQTEDLIGLLKRDPVTFDFNNVEHMAHHICHYWTGLTVTEFLALFSESPLGNLVSEPKTALAIYLIKLRTGESNRRLASLFNMCRSTLESHMNYIIT